MSGARGETAARIVVALLLAGCSPAEEERPVDPADALQADPRIAVLLDACPPAQVGFYTRDTSDMLPVLIEKLVRGKLDPLKRAKEELGAMGARSAPELRRLYERYATNMFTSAYVENALDAAALNPSDEVREMILLGIRHPQESVRQKALTALTRGHARPEDFDHLVAHVEGLEPVQLQRPFAGALHAADSERAERLYLEWFRGGKHVGVWGTIAPLLAETELADVREGAAELMEDLDPAVGRWLAVPAAREGDPAARALLAREARSEVYGRRARAIEALSSAGFLDELVRLALEDVEPELRLLAAGALGEAEVLAPAHVEGLRVLLDDPSPAVRSHALGILVEKRDPPAVQRALAQLDGGASLLQDALLALRLPMREDPDLAREALRRLLDRYGNEAHRPLGERQATLKGIGQVPLREAAEALRRIALEAPDAPMENLRAHEWIMIQAANTGSEGLAWLASELEHELDPLRRVDILWATSAERTPEARERLLAFAQEGRRSPYELLFAAGRLANIGPSSRVAPLLKRMSYEVDHREVREALQCLLWTWY